MAIHNSTATDRNFMLVSDQFPHVQRPLEFIGDLKGDLHVIFRDEGEEALKTAESYVDAKRAICDGRESVVADLPWGWYSPQTVAELIGKLINYLKHQGKVDLVAHHLTITEWGPDTKPTGIYAGLPTYRELEKKLIEREFDRDVAPDGFSPTYNELEDRVGQLCEEVADLEQTISDKEDALSEIYSIADMNL